MHRGHAPADHSMKRPLGTLYWMAGWMSHLPECGAAMIAAAVAACTSGPVDVSEPDEAASLQKGINKAQSKRPYTV